MTDTLYDQIVEDILTNFDSGILRIKLDSRKIILYGKNLELKSYVGKALEQVLHCEVEIQHENNNNNFQHYNIDTDWFLSNYLNRESA